MSIITDKDVQAGTEARCESRSRTLHVSLLANPAADTSRAVASERATSEADVATGSAVEEMAAMVL